MADTGGKAMNLIAELERLDKEQDDAGLSVEGFKDFRRLHLFMAEYADVILRRLKAGEKMATVIPMLRHADYGLKQLDSVKTKADESLAAWTAANEEEGKL